MTKPESSRIKKSNTPASKPEQEFKPVPFDDVVKRLWASPPQPRVAKKKKMPKSAKTV